MHSFAGHCIKCGERSVYVRIRMWYDCMKLNAFGWQGVPYRSAHLSFAVLLCSRRSWPLGSSPAGWGAIECFALCGTWVSTPGEFSTTIYIWSSWKLYIQNSWQHKWIIIQCKSCASHSLVVVCEIHRIFEYDYFNDVVFLSIVCLELVGIANQFFSKYYFEYSTANVSCWWNSNMERNHAFRKKSKLQHTIRKSYSML